jgi:hypothetical protein
MLLGSYGDDMRDDMWMPRRAGTNRRGVSPAHLPPILEGLGEHVHAGVNTQIV